MNDIETLKPILEAVLLAAGEPLSLDRLQAIFGEDDNSRPSKPDLRQALEALSQDYIDQQRSLVLKEVASGYCLQINQEYSQWVGQLWQEKPPRYSRAVMETLAIIAYRQPITRAEIEDIRGVAVSSQIVKTLLEREWIHIIGERDTPGRPSLYATTSHFLDYFNLKTLEDLPTLMQLQAPVVEDGSTVSEVQIPEQKLIALELAHDPEIAEENSETLTESSAEVTEDSHEISEVGAEAEEPAETDIAEEIEIIEESETMLELDIIATAEEVELNGENGELVEEQA